MAVTVTNPAAGEITYFSIPIDKSKTQETAAVNPVDGTPDIIIWGKATDGSVDGDLQIVDPEWSGPALRKWLDSCGNVRASHDPHQEVGKGLEVELTPDGHWVKSLIVDPNAKHKIRTGVLNDYSIGVTFPKIDQDQTGKALNGIIRGGPHTQICELSVVGRGSNYNSRFQMVKAAPDGQPVYTGKMIEASLTKAEKSATVSVELPKDLKLRVTPNDLAKIIRAKGAVEKRKMDPDVGGGVDRDKIPATDFAGEDRSFPIVTPGDVSDAASSVGRARGQDKEKIKRKIKNIAHRKGPKFEAELPESYKKPKKEKAHGVSGVSDGAPGVPGGQAPLHAGAPGGEPGQAPGGDQQLVKELQLQQLVGVDGHDEAAHLEGLSPAPVEKSDDDKKVRQSDAASTFDSDAQASDDQDVAGEGDAGDDSEGDSDEGYASPARAKKKGKKGKKSGKKAMKGMSEDWHPHGDRSMPTPGDGVVGAHMDPVGPHREPDGQAIEAFEHDARLPTDPDSEYKTIVHFRELNIPTELGTLHSLTCPAYHPDAVKAAHPYADLSEIDDLEWGRQAGKTAAMGTAEEAVKSQMLWGAASTLRQTDPGLLDALRDEAHKSFMDANPGPGSFPTPSMPSGRSFHRPVITEGRARLGSDYEGPNSSPRRFSDIAPGQFDRGFMQGGRAEDSPSNEHEDRAVQPPSGTGRPQRVFYSEAQRANARQAMRTMHDHIAQTFPDLCPLSPHTSDMTDTPAPNHGVPAVGAPATKGAKSMKKGKKGKKGKLPPFLQDKVDDKKDGDEKESADKSLAPEAPVSVEKAAVITSAPDIEALFKSAFPEMVTKAVTDATGPLLARLEKADKALAKQQRRNKALAERLESLEGMPDPRVLPFRGGGYGQAPQFANKSSARDAVPTASAIRDGAQLASLHQLNRLYQETPRPQDREGALREIYQMTGVL